MLMFTMLIDAFVEYTWFTTHTSSRYVSNQTAIAGGQISDGDALVILRTDSKSAMDLLRVHGGLTANAVG